MVTDNGFCKCNLDTDATHYLQYCGLCGRKHKRTIKNPLKNKVNLTPEDVTDAIKLMKESDA